MAVLEVDHYRRIFSVQSFRLFWLGFAFSALGDAMTRVALTWLVYEKTDSARALGGLMLCFTGPIIVGGLMAGWLLDRFDRRRVMLVDNAVRGAAVALVPLLHALGRLELWHIYAVAAVYGLLMMISLAGGPSLIPSIVRTEHLATANALEMLGFTVAGIAGPALAGLLVAWIGASNVVLIDAVSYACFALALWRILRLMPAATAGTARATGVSYSLGDAVRLMLSSPILLSTTLMFMAYNIGSGILFVWLPLLADRVLNGGSGLYGTLLAVLSAGEVVAVVLAGTLVLRRPLGTLICAAQFLSGAALLILPFSQTLPGAVVALVLFGGISAPLTIWAQTLRMQIIPEHLRGRTFALLRMLMQGGNPIGGTIAGLFLPLVGIPAMIVISALMGLVPGLVGYQVRPLRVADVQREPAPVPVPAAAPLLLGEEEEYAR